MSGNRPRWECSECGRRFANLHQWHVCGTLADLDSHFTGRSPLVRQRFDGFADLVRACVPVTILPQKTRIAFQARMSFAAVMVRPNWLIGHLVLDRPVDHPRIMRMKSFSPRNHAHTCFLEGLEELDEELAGWIREAYAVGRQEHLGGPAPRSGAGPEGKE